MRFLSGRGISLSHTFYDDESALTLSAVSVTVWAEGNSTPVVSAVAATVDANQAWSVTIPAQPQGRYSVKWDGGSAVDMTNFEVTGNILFTIPEFRATFSDMTAARFPAEKVRQYREQAEVEFQRICGRSFVPRSTTMTAFGDGTGSLRFAVWDVASISAISVDGTPESDLTVWQMDDAGVLLYKGQGVPGGYWDWEYPIYSTIYQDAKVDVTMDYGFRAVPEDVKRAAMIRVRYLLSAENTGIPDRAISFIADNGGTFSLATAGQKGFETGIPEVDAVIKGYRYDIINSVGM